MILRTEKGKLCVWLRGRKQGLLHVLDPTNQSSNSKFLGVGEGPESREAGAGESPLLPPPPPPRLGTCCGGADNVSRQPGFADPWKEFRASPHPHGPGARTPLETVGIIKHFEQRCAFVIR